MFKALLKMRKYLIFCLLLLLISIVPQKTIIILKQDYKKMHAAALEVEASMIQKMAGDRASDILSLYASVVSKLNK